MYDECGFEVYIKLYCGEGVFGCLFMVEVMLIDWFGWECYI